MRKIWLFSLSLFLFCGFSYSLLWYYQADRAQKELEERLKNAHTTYDSITKGGFPFTVSLVLENPSITLPNIGYGPMSAVCYGKMHLTLPLSGSRIRLENSDKNHIIISIPKKTSPNVWELKGQWLLEVDSEKFLFDTLKNELSNFQLSEKKEASFVQKYRIESLISSVKRKRTSSERETLSLDCRLKGIEQILQFPLNFASKYSEKEGKSNCSFTAACDLPSQDFLLALAQFPKRIFNEPIPELSLTLDNFILANNFSQSKGDLRLSCKEDKDNVVTLHLSSHLSFTQEKGTHEALLALIDTMPIEPNPEPSESVHQYVYALLQNKEAFKKLIPHFDELYPITCDLNGSLLFDKRSSEMKAELRNGMIHTTPYGMNLKGSASLDPAFMSLQGVLEIQHFPKMMQDLVGYCSRLFDAITSVKPPEKPLFNPFTTDTQEAFMSVLADMGTLSENKQDITIAFSCDNNQIKIGEMNNETLRSCLLGLLTEVMIKTDPSILQVPQEPK